MVYKIEPLEPKALFGPVADATAVLTRLDERLARSPVREGWICRQQFADAAAALWLEGELVHAEDLVLHDAHMDIRMPTHELTRAHAVLRARRQIDNHRPDWALSGDGLRALTRRGRGGDAASPLAENGLEEEGANGGADEIAPSGLDADGAFARALDAMDAALERSAKALGSQTSDPPPEWTSWSGRPELVYDQDWDEGARLDEWLAVMGETKALPAVLRAAIMIDAWGEIEVLQRAAWLGPLLAAALLRQAGLAVHHLPSFTLGAKQIPRERRRAPDRTQRLTACVEALGMAAAQGLKDHDRLMQAKAQMERRLKGKRKNSKLPQLIDFALSRPLITAPLVEKELKLSLQGALNLIGELGLREVTGRGRYRAWGAG